MPEFRTLDFHLGETIDMLRDSVRAFVEQVVGSRPVLLQICQREVAGAPLLQMHQRGAAGPVRNAPTAQDRVQVDQRKAVVRTLVRQREAKACGQGSVAHPTKERIFQVQKAVAHAFGKATRAVTTALQLEQIS